MRTLMKVGLITAGTVFVGGGLATYAVTSSPPQADTGGGLAPTKIGPVPKLKSDPMQPADQEEANRRATRNARDAEAAEKKGESYIAPPLITGTETKQVALVVPPKPPMPEVVQPDPEKLAVPNTVPTTSQPTTQQSEADRRRETEFDNLVKAQIESLMKESRVAQWATVAFKAPLPPPKPEPKPAAAKPTRGGEGEGGRGPQQPAIVNVLAAKPGDQFYSRLTVGFNSDDPQGLPVFTTIHDERPDGSYGPLHGARGMGSVVFNKDQASVLVQKLILPDGREAPVKAMLVTLDEVRSGVAQTVDYHTLSRWSGLLAGSLIQGIGQAGQQSLANNRSFFASPGGYASIGNPGVDWAQIGLASLAPLGQNLSTAFAQDFRRQPTKSARGGPNGWEVGIVFLENVTIPTYASAVGGVAGTGPGASMNVRY